MDSRLRKLSYFFKEPRNRFPAWRAGTTSLFDLPARQTINRLSESIPWNRFLGSLNVYKFGLGSVLEREDGGTLASAHVSLRSNIIKKYCKSDIGANTKCTNSSLYAFKNY